MLGATTMHQAYAYLADTLLEQDLSHSRAAHPTTRVSRRNMVHAAQTSDH